MFKRPTINISNKTCPITQEQISDLVTRGPNSVVILDLKYPKIYLAYDKDSLKAWFKSKLPQQSPRQIIVNFQDILTTLPLPTLVFPTKAKDMLFPSIRSSKVSIPFTVLFLVVIHMLILIGMGSFLIEKDWVSNEFKPYAKKASAIAFKYVVVPLTVFLLLVTFLLVILEILHHTEKYIASKQSHSLDEEFNRWFSRVFVAYDPEIHKIISEDKKSGQQITHKS